MSISFWRAKSFDLRFRKSRESCVVGFIATHLARTFVSSLGYRLLRRLYFVNLAVPLFQAAATKLPRHRLIAVLLSSLHAISIGLSVYKQGRSVV